jgi:hypothetical protein
VRSVNASLVAALVFMLQIRMPKCESERVNWILIEVNGFQWHLGASHIPYEKMLMLLIWSNWRVLDVIRVATIENDTANSIASRESDRRLWIAAYLALFRRKKASEINTSLRLFINNNYSLDNYTDRYQSL